jgi:hypothetical protein
MHDGAAIFNELAPFLRVRPQLQQICRFGAQWSSQHEPEPEGWAPFHIVTCGSCLLDVGDRRGIALRAGNVAAPLERRWCVSSRPQLTWRLWHFFWSCDSTWHVIAYAPPRSRSQ